MLTISRFFCIVLLKGGNVYHKSVNTFSKTLVKDPLHISGYHRLFYGYGLDMKLFPPYYFHRSIEDTERQTFNHIY